MAHDDALTILSESPFFIPSLVALLADLSTALWEEEPELMASPALLSEAVAGIARGVLQEFCYFPSWPYFEGEDRLTRHLVEIVRNFCSCHHPNAVLILSFRNTLSECACNRINLEMASGVTSLLDAGLARASNCRKISRAYTWVNYATWPWPTPPLSTLLWLVILQPQRGYTEDPDHSNNNDNHSDNSNNGGFDGGFEGNVTHQRLLSRH